MEPTTERPPGKNPSCVQRFVSLFKKRRILEPIHRRAKLVERSTSLRLCLRSWPAPSHHGLSSLDLFSPVVELVAASLQNPVVVDVLGCAYLRVFTHETPSSLSERRSPCHVPRAIRSCLAHVLHGPI